MYLIPKFNNENERVQNDDYIDVANDASIRTLH